MMTAPSALRYAAREAPANAGAAAPQPGFAAERADPSRQSLQKSLNRSGAISVYRTVCWMFLCPR
jgi:hypothetical protein